MYVCTEYMLKMVQTMLRSIAEYKVTVRNYVLREGADGTGWGLRGSGIGWRQCVQESDSLEKEDVAEPGCVCLGVVETSTREGSSEQTCFN